MKQTAITRLKFASVLMVIYFIVFFGLNFNYIESLNDFFSILTDNSTELTDAVNAGRYQMNSEFITTELILGVVGVMVVGFEIYCIRKLIKVYKNLAFKDPLTGSLSRASLNEAFDSMERKKNVREITYFLFDMNYLKQVNDGYGHKIGDDFLIAMSKCIRNAFNGIGKVYRLAGDEFVAIVTKPNELDPERLVSRIDREVKVYNEQYNRTKVDLSFSKGYYTGPYDYKDSYFRDTLYTLADNAMYEEKEAFHQLHPRSEKIDRETKEIVVRTL